VNRQQQHRHLATSAQKRKWKQKRQQQQQCSKQSNNGFFDEINQIDSDPTSAGGTVNWRPIFFLGVFPLIMSGVVVLLRDDLREELEERGIGRFVKDIKQWRTVRAIELEQKQGDTKKKELEDNNG
jgi:hypothetical protein